MYAEKDKTADAIRIKYEIRKLKMFYRSHCLSDLESVFTVGLVAARFSKLDPMLIYFDNFFSDSKVAHPLHVSYPGVTM